MNAANTSRVVRYESTGLERVVRAIAGSVLTMAVLGSGCDSTGSNSGFASPDQSGGDEWTIVCFKSDAPNHAQLCRSLGDFLGQANRVDLGKIQVKSDEYSSRLCYGMYERRRSRDGRLTFPPEMQADLDMIRSLRFNQGAPFAMAMPEPVASGAPVDQGMSQWHVSRAKGEYTLLIAAFFDTGDFRQRKEAAEQYVEVLRGEGVDAYYMHEQVKSYVCVGNFERSDFVQAPNGQWLYGPRVTDFIEKRPDDEFRYMTENGAYRLQPTPMGEMSPPPSQLVKVPRSPDQGLWRK